MLRSMIRQLLIATYNVDFHSRFFNERFGVLFKTVNNANCDIIAFQEVPVQDVETIASTLQMSYPYHITSYRQSDTFRTYTEMIFSRIPFTSTGYYKFEETSQDRCLLWGNINHNGEHVTIATSHLESIYTNMRIRLIQADKIHELLGNNPNVVFLGDLNTEEHLGQLSEHWKESHNCNQTWFLRRLYPDKDDVRKQYDRVFMSPIWKLSTPAKIITPLVSEYLTKECVWTSDHDGLLVTI